MLSEMIVLSYSTLIKQSTLSAKTYGKTARMMIPVQVTIHCSNQIDFGSMACRLVEAFRSECAVVIAVGPDDPLLRITNKDLPAVSIRNNFRDQSTSVYVKRNFDIDCESNMASMQKWQEAEMVKHVKESNLWK